MCTACIPHKIDLGMIIEVHEFEHDVAHAVPVAFVPIYASYIPRQILDDENSNHDSFPFPDMKVMSTLCNDVLQHKARTHLLTGL